MLITVMGVYLKVAILQSVTSCLINSRDTF